MIFLILYIIYIIYINYIIYLLQDYIPSPVLPLKIAQDVPTDLLPTDMLFRYVVKRSDNILSLQHSGPKALSVVAKTNPNGNSNSSIVSRIVHATMNPTLDADLLLRDPSDFTPQNGLIQVLLSDIDLDLLDYF